MVNVYTIKCRTKSCGKVPPFGVTGPQTTQYCAQHAPGRDGQRLQARKCRTESCGKIPSFGVAGTKTVEYCAQHAPGGMVNVCSKEV